MWFNLFCNFGFDEMILNWCILFLWCSIFLNKDKLIWFYKKVI